MKVLSRDFKTSEKILILLLILAIIGLVYYQFVYKAAQDSIAEAEMQRDELQLELSVASLRLEQLEQMQRELDAIDTGSGLVASYNNSQVELALLNNILGAVDRYSISFADVTQEGDLVRRNFSLDFTANSFATVKNIISQLTNGEYRCMIGNMNYTVENDEMRVSATATFYETMVGGESDTGLAE